MTPEDLRRRAVDGLNRLSNTERRILIENIRKLAVKRKITYEYDKSAGEEPIRILMPPVFLEKTRLPQIRGICAELARACEKILSIFLERPEARIFFPFEEDEENMLLTGNPELHAKSPAIWQRLDASMDPAAPVESLRFMETNMNSVGGVYYAPAVEKLVMESVLPKLLDQQDLARISPNEDLEKLLFDLLNRHARGRGGMAENDTLRVAVVENDPDADGCTESPAVVEGLCELGADAFLARPEEFEIRGMHLIHMGRPVDVVYRLFEIREMKEMAAIQPLKLAFAQNRVVSSLGGEFDHKSIFELFTSAAFERLFQKNTVRLFRKHVLWTRLLRQTFTDAPDGSRIDLPEFACSARERLVLKPNRSYGGDGILIGRETEERKWREAVEKALQWPTNFVVQAFHPLTELPFPVIDPAGGIAEEHLHIVFGFSETPSGFGVIGRASRSGIVNVAQHGGLVPVLRS